MAYARSIMALCAVVNMAAARITDKSLPVLGLDASEAVAQLPSADSTPNGVYKFDVDELASLHTRTPNAMRNRRAADIDYCAFKVECAAEAAKEAKATKTEEYTKTKQITGDVNKCCKTCQIGGYEYRLDVGTFARTHTRGTKKDPQPLWKYCGLPHGKSWPTQMDWAVGSVQIPFKTSKVGPGPLFVPKKDSADKKDRELDQYSDGNDVLFVKHSYKMMVSAMRTGLTGLVAEWNALPQASGKLKLLVHQGYEPLPDDKKDPGAYDLFYEAREVELLLVMQSYTPALENVGVGKDMWGLNSVPACLKKGEATNDELKKCYTGTNSLIFNNPYIYRLLADMAYEHGDAVSNEYLKGSIKGTSSQLTSIHLAVRDDHRQCGATADIAFLLDSSGSVGPDGWNEQLKFVQQFAADIQPSESGSRIAMATFSGPRYSHFADHYAHTDTIVEKGKVTKQDIPCKTENDCPHYDNEVEHGVGTRERCDTVAGRCVLDVPSHCPIGTLYEMGTQYFGGKIQSHGCICRSGEKCSGATWKGDMNLDVSDPKYVTQEGCRSGFFRFNTDDCGKFTDQANAKGARLDMDSFDGKKLPKCEAGREFFSHGCTDCNCGTKPDYKYEEHHSAWTNFNFKKCPKCKVWSAKEIKDDMDAGLNMVSTPIAGISKPVMLPEKCPEIGRGTSHETQDYEDWEKRDKYCYDDGASHLSMGLKHVLLGSGEGAEKVSGLFSESNGARPKSQGVPRILIVLSDGKSNPHFEPYQIAPEFAKNDIRVFTIGMGDRPGRKTTMGTADRRDYQQELNAMASDPLDRHRFDLDKKKGHLADLLRYIEDDLCELPRTLGPGDWVVDPQDDAGTVTNFVYKCDKMTETVYVAATGPVKVFVSGGKNAPKHPSEFTGGAVDVSDTNYKLVTFTDAALPDTQTIYIGVSKEPKVNFQINVFLDLFTQGYHKTKSPATLSPNKVLYTPTLKAAYGTLADYTVELTAPSDKSGTLAQSVKFAGGKFVLTDEAQSLNPNGVLEGIIELRIFHKTDGSKASTPGCLDGMMRLHLEEKPDFFDAKWELDDTTTYGAPHQIVEVTKSGELRNQRKMRRSATFHNPVTTMTAACCTPESVEGGKDPQTACVPAACVITSYTLETDTADGACRFNNEADCGTAAKCNWVETPKPACVGKPMFQVNATTGAISLTDGMPFDFEDENRYVLEVSARNDVLAKGVAQKSQPNGKFIIELQNVRERPTLVYDTAIDITGEDGLKGNEVAKVVISNPDFNTNPKPVDWAGLSCETTTAGFTVEKFTADSLAFTCLIKPTTNMDLSTTGSVTVDVKLKYNSIEQDAKSVELKFTAGKGNGNGKCKFDANGEVESCKDCVFPFYGTKCEKGKDDVDPCSQAGGKTCLNDGNCTLAKSPDDPTPDSGKWIAVCVCKFAAGNCKYGAECDSSINCPPESQSCKRFEPKSRGDKAVADDICSKDKCEPSFINKYCLAGVKTSDKAGGDADDDDDLDGDPNKAVKKTTVPPPRIPGGGIDTTEDPALAGESSDKDKDDGDDDTAMIIGIIVGLLLLCCLIVGALFLMKKKRDEDAVKNALTADRQSRRGTNPSSAHGADLGGGLYEDTTNMEAKQGAAPVSNPMYGAGGMGGGGNDQGGLYDMSVDKDQSSAPSVSNPMYGQGGNSDTYGAAQPGSGGGYRDVAPNQAPTRGGAMQNEGYLSLGADPVANPTYDANAGQGGYRDVAPNAPGGYRDVAPNANPKNDTYIENVRGTQAAPTYDSAAVNEGTYDMAQGSESNYDSASAGDTRGVLRLQSPYDMADTTGGQSNYDTASSN